MWSLSAPSDKDGGQYSGLKKLSVTEVQNFDNLELSS